MQLFIEIYNIFKVIKAAIDYKGNLWHNFNKKILLLYISLIKSSKRGQSYDKRKFFQIYKG